MYSISVLLMAMGTALFIAHLVTGVIRVLFFSRISHIPGLKLAALTIGPDEVHIDDASFYSSCYPDLEVKIQEKVIRFRERLLEYAADKEKGSAPIDFSNATGALTLDIISGYTLGKSIGALDRTDLVRDYHEALRNSAKLGPIARAFPFIPRANGNAAGLDSQIKT
ncbi:hypothetical protein NHJ13051_007447 [Beauveria bassiana]